MKTYYIADLHFGHKNIIKWEHRPWNTIEQMDEGLIERWNMKVKDEDHVWILGDLTFYKDKERNISLITRLKGHKHLIQGNHDYWVKEGYLNQYFESIDKYRRVQDNDRDVILFHYPIFSWDKMKFGSYHLYGHVHTDPEYQLNIDNSFNVGAGLHKFFPMTLDELLEER